MKIEEAIAAVREGRVVGHTDFPGVQMTTAAAIVYRASYDYELAEDNGWLVVLTDDELAVEFEALAEQARAMSAAKDMAAIAQVAQTAVSTYLRAADMLRNRSR